MGTYTVTATVTFSIECDNQLEAEDIVVTMLHHEADQVIGCKNNNLPQKQPKKKG